MPTPAKTKMYLLLMCLLAPVLVPSTAQAEDYSDWYQVEVIVFANQTPLSTDEVWPLVPLSYPAPMATIAPEDPESLTPYSLDQLGELESYLNMFNGDLSDASESGTATNTQNDGFLFESRSRFSVPVEVKTPLAADADANGSVAAVDFDALFDSTTPQAFTALPEAQRLLNTQARSLRRSSLYRTLFHQSWLQPISADKASIPIMIQAGKHYDDSFELDGTIKVSRSRFLHMETDLWFTEFAPLYQQDEMSGNTAGNFVSPEIRRQFPELAAWEASRGQYVPVHSHQLQQSRRMRSSTLHFIDHPRFGILVMVEAFERSSSD